MRQYFEVELPTVSRLLVGHAFGRLVRGVSLWAVGRENGELFGCGCHPRERSARRAESGKRNDQWNQATDETRMKHGLKKGIGCFDAS